MRKYIRYNNLKYESIQIPSIDELKSQGYIGKWRLGKYGWYGELTKNKPNIIQRILNYPSIWQKL